MAVSTTWPATGSGSTRNHNFDSVPSVKNSPPRTCLSQPYAILPPLEVYMVNSLSRPDSRPATPPPSSARGSASRSHVTRPAGQIIDPHPHSARWTRQRFPEPRSATCNALPMQSGTTPQPADQSKSNQIKPIAGPTPQSPSASICVHQWSKSPVIYPHRPNPKTLAFSIQPLAFVKKSFKNAKIKLFPESSTCRHKHQPRPGVLPLRPCASASLRYLRQSRHIKANQGLSRYFGCYIPSPSMSAHRPANQSLDVGRSLLDVGCFPNF